MKRALAERSVAELSGLKGEPSWLLEKRLEAWRAYEALPLPKPSDDVWRRTDLGRLKLESFGAFTEPSAPVAEAHELSADLRSLARLDGARAGVAVQADSSAVFSALSEELADKGIIFTSLDRAVADYPDLVRERLLSAVQPGENKFTALHSALWSGGVFLYVPRNVQVELPFHAIVHLSQAELGLFPHTLVVLEPGSSATLVEEHISSELAATSFVSPMVESFIGEGAHLRYTSLVQWSDRVFTIGLQRNLLSRDARVETMSVLLGGGVTKSHVESLLKEPGAHSDMLGIAFGGGSQHFDQYTLQDHQAPHTTSDLLYKAALRDKSRSIYYGLIHLRKPAQKAQAFQTNRNLILGDGARADSIPVLEIEADDVRCSHAAAVGPVDPDQLFYLMARGLDATSATRMLVEGFFEPLVARIPIEWVRQRLESWIHAKIGG